ncbi:MAG: dihydroorotate dehydrogenase [candidate division WOR-3 bacterium]|nr:dihydroorotate dehydrogenase [candidate division WOR-3 bacterium]
MNAAVTIGRTTFANPVLVASGTFEFGLKFPSVANRLGGVVTKAITMQARVGNPPPRICEFPGGILNSVGLENPGVEKFCTEIVPRTAKLKSRVVVNVAGFTVEEYGELAARLDSESVDALEVNVSCPNVKEGGALFGQQPQVVEAITALVRKETTKTIIIKLTANFVDPVETAKAAEAAGADGVTLINTLFGLALDENGRPFLGGRSGGVSGPALKPFALFCVDRVAAAVKIPIVGCGGIMNGQDALDFLSAGARMVQVGTASLVNPEAALEVWTGLKEYSARNRLTGWEQLVGRTRRHGGGESKSDVRS